MPEPSKNAADICKKAAFQIDTAYTSLLERAVETLEILLAELGQNSISIQPTWCLNERHYGCLQGLNKAETARRLGAQLVMGWRRSYSIRPPTLELDDYRHPRFDPLYAHIPDEILPRTESLADTEARIVPYLQDNILPEIKTGKNVLLVAHGNTLRALVSFLESIPIPKIPDLIIPTGMPIFYRYDPAENKFCR